MIDYYACSPPDPPEPPNADEPCAFCSDQEPLWPEDEIRCNYCGMRVCLDCSDKMIRDGKWLYCSQQCKEE